MLLYATTSIQLAPIYRSRLVSLPSHNAVRFVLSPALSSTERLKRCASGQSHKRERASPPISKYAALIDPSSLRRTLAAHREANRARLIRKVGGAEGPVPIEIPSLVKKDEAVGIERAGLDFAPAESNSTPVRHIFSKRERHDKSPVLSERSSNPRGLTSEWQQSQPQVHRYRFPWYTSTWHTDVDATPIEKLAAEIRGFAQYFSPTAEEQEGVKLAVQHIEHGVGQANPELRVELVGSRATGLASPLSDLDLNLLTSNGQRLDDVTDREQAIEVLQRLFHSLDLEWKQRREFSSVAIYPRLVVDLARVPILIGTHIGSGLEFQLQQNISCYNTMEYARAFNSEYPTLRYLFAVLKQMLRIRGLGDGAAGGLSSYPLLNMIVASLKFGQGEFDRNDVANHLLFFLEMFSEIDFRHTGLSVAPLGYLRRENKPVSGKSIKLSDSPERMFLQDPADPSNDLGRGFHRVRQVQNIFSATRRAIKDTMQTLNKAGPVFRMDQSPPPPLLAYGLEADYRVYEMDRRTLRQFAARQTAHSD